MFPPAPTHEERLALLIRRLPPAPRPWVEAAVAVPTTRRALDQILALAQADSEFRSELLADLDRAVERAGHEPDPRLARQLRSALESEY